MFGWRTIRMIWSSRFYSDKMRQIRTVTQNVHMFRSWAKKLSIMHGGLLVLEPWSACPAALAWSRHLHCWVTALSGKRRQKTHCRQFCTGSMQVLYARLSNRPEPFHESPLDAKISLSANWTEQHHEIYMLVRYGGSMWRSTSDDVPPIRPENGGLFCDMVLVPSP